MKVRTAIKTVSNSLAVIAGVWLMLAWIPVTRGPVLAISEFAWGDILPVFPAGDCRIRNSDLASRKQGSTVVLGEIVGAGQFGKHVWAVTPDGAILDQVCPPSLKGCSPRVAYAVVDSNNQISSFDGAERGRVMIGYEMTRRMLRAWL